MIDSLTLSCIFFRKTFLMAHWKKKYGMESKDVIKEMKLFM